MKSLEKYHRQKTFESIKNGKREIDFVDFVSKEFANDENGHFFSGVVVRADL